MWQAFVPASPPNEREPQTSGFAFLKFLEHVPHYRIGTHWAIFLIHKDMLQPQPAATSCALLGYSCSETKHQSESSQQTAPPLHHLPYMQNESPRENRSILICHKRILCNFCPSQVQGTGNIKVHMFLPTRSPCCGQQMTTVAALSARLSQLHRTARDVCPILGRCCQSLSELTGMGGVCDDTVDFGHYEIPM